ncbi:MAG: hypothetical protein JNK82_18520 [Myxococcaceae bacterium]|nr:hypothetical protein [Myxococcaceae bacterium]
MNELPLPTGLRRVTIVALVLSGLLGFGAAQGVTALYDPPSSSDLEASIKPVPGLAGQPELFREAVTAMAMAQISAFESMRGSRTAILFGLWATSALVFVASLRMMKPRGAPREGVRRLLATATLVTAVLRTLDGAQAAAVAKRAGAAFDKVLSKSTELPGGWPDGLWATGFTGLSMLMSLVVGGGLLLLSRYYRSDRVRDVTLQLDGSPPP